MPIEGFELVETTSRLALYAVGKGAPGPIWADFLSPQLRRRSREPGFRRQPLARAVGLARPGREPPFVVDATAGLGRDAALLVLLGCRVLAVERSELLFSLLEDARARAVRDPTLGAAFEERLALVRGDACEVLSRLRGEGSAPEVVYLDPMFPARTKSALVKKEMQVLKALHGAGTEDAPALLQAAREAARARVVVKRPKGAPPLGPGVSHRFDAGGVRFDLYLT